MSLYNTHPLSHFMLHCEVTIRTTQSASRFFLIDAAGIRPAVNQTAGWICAKIPIGIVTSACID